MLSRSAATHFRLRCSFCSIHAVHHDHDTIPAVHHPALLLLHALSITSSPHAPVSIHHALISAYGARDDLRAAREVFERMPQRTAVSYNSLIAASARSVRPDHALPLLPRMLRAGLRPTCFTCAPLLSLPTLGIARGLQLHALLLKSGLLHSEPFSGTALLGFYARNGALDDALHLFEEMPTRTVVTWNSIISAFSRMGFVDDSMNLFRQLLRAGIGLNHCSFLCLLPAFASVDCLVHLEHVHALSIKSAMDSFHAVGNALLSALSNCFRVHTAERLFNYMAIKDEISWNTLIAGFAKSGMPDRALEFFLMMLQSEVCPSEATFASVLNACCAMDAMHYGEFVHAKAIKFNLEISVFVGSSLIDLYMRWKCFHIAQRAFHEIPDKNVVSWNTLISGYSGDDSKTSVILLRQMLRSTVRPNEYSLSSVLNKVSPFELQQLHSLIIRMGYDLNHYVSSAIITSYDSHGIDTETFSPNLEFCQQFPFAHFNVVAGIYNRNGRYQETEELLLRQKNLDNVSWNILLTACAHKKEHAKVFQLFKHMRYLGNSFDNHTAMSLLSCCSKLNSLPLGRSVHGLTVKTNSGCLDTFVCNLLLDMYAKCGDLEGCTRVFSEMNERNLVSWTALISGLGLHGHPQKALDNFKQMESEGFEPDQIALLAVLSACRHGGLVEEGMLLFRRMKSDYKIEPEMDHYTCVVDMLCKYGHLKEAELVISSMPFQPSATLWRIFLLGCRRFDNLLI